MTGGLRISALGALCALGLTLGAPAAQAALIYDQTLTPVSSDGDTTFFDDDNDFNESFDFTALDILSIDRFELTLTSAGFSGESGCGLFLGFIPFCDSEDWNVRAQGSASGAADDLISPINAATQTFVYTATSDTGGVDVFAHSAATQVFTFWLAEQSSDDAVSNPSITVSSANLKIYGELAVIPVPAALPLLVLGLGGLGLAARRQPRRAA